MKKYIVITSIFKPTEAVKKFASLKDWQLIVVGDKKTPNKWHHKNVEYLSPDLQLKSHSQFAEALPWNMYSRKNIGYLEAIQSGAEVIADTDDDNIPYTSWSNGLDFEGVFDTVETVDYYNVYNDFTSEHIWPRGYPLKKILDPVVRIKQSKQHNIGVWQGLADGDPDVDAIYRLIYNKAVIFGKREPLVLAKGTVCPFNSQNTIFIKELFPLLYLPSFVTFRFTDILRGLIAQPIMWNAGYTLGFHTADVFQQRNEHDYLVDFKSEIPCYLDVEQVIDVTKKAVSKNKSVSENLVDAYQALQKVGIVTENEVNLVQLWTKSIGES
ncbi:MAG: hypothetical protein QG639_601 [Patescibacteria group bacterium]|jgi:hypothetical protein|nr:hypothetical protein [Patescibacteria group bacterium]